MSKPSFPTAVLPLRRGPGPPRLAWELGLPQAFALALRSEVTACRLAAATASGPSGDTTTAVHDLRRSLRRLRALLRLGAAGLGVRRTRAATVTLGSLARALSPARDAAVLPALLERLPPAVGHRLRPLAGQWLRDAALVCHDAALPALLHRVAASVEQTALALTQHLHRLAPRHLAHGLKAMQRRFARSRRRALRDPRPSALHALRKRAKDLRHAVEWLGTGLDHRLKRQRRALVTVTVLLGESNDARVLEVFLAERAAPRWARRAAGQMAQRPVAAALRASRRVRVHHAKRAVARARQARISVTQLAGPSRPAARWGR